MNFASVNLLGPSTILFHELPSKLPSAGARFGKSKIKLEIGFEFNYKLEKHLFSCIETTIQRTAKATLLPFCSASK
jgi:hypothetical protein